MRVQSCPSSDKLAAFLWPCWHPLAQAPAMHKEMFHLLQCSQDVDTFPDMVHDARLRLSSNVETVVPRQRALENEQSITHPSIDGSVHDDLPCHPWLWISESWQLMKARNLKNTGGEWNAEVKKQMLEWSHDEVSTLVKSLLSTIPGPDYQILHLQHTTHPSPPHFWKSALGNITMHTTYLVLKWVLPSLYQALSLTQKKKLWQKYSYGQF